MSSKPWGAAALPEGPRYLRILARLPRKRGASDYGSELKLCIPGSPTVSGRICDSNPTGKFV